MLGPVGEVGVFNAVDLVDHRKSRPGDLVAPLADGAWLEIIGGEDVTGKLRDRREQASLVVGMGDHAECQQASVPGQGNELLVGPYRRLDAPDPRHNAPRRALETSIRPLRIRPCMPACSPLTPLRGRRGTGTGRLLPVLGADVVHVLYLLSSGQSRRAHRQLPMSAPGEGLMSGDFFDDEATECACLAAVRPGLAEEADDPPALAIPLRRHP